MINYGVHEDSFISKLIDTDDEMSEVDNEIYDSDGRDESDYEINNNEENEDENNYETNNNKLFFGYGPIVESEKSTDVNKIYMINIDAKIIQSLKNKLDLNRYLNNWFKTGKIYGIKNENDIDSFLFNDRLNPYKMIEIVHNKNDELISTKDIYNFISKNFEVLIYNNESPQKFQQFTVFLTTWNKFKKSYLNRIQYLLNMNLTVSDNLYEKFFNKFSLGYISKCFFKRVIYLEKNISKKPSILNVFNLFESKKKTEEHYIFDYWNKLAIITSKIYKKLSKEKFLEYSFYLEDIIDKKTPIPLIIQKFVPKELQKDILIEKPHVECIHYKILEKYGKDYIVLRLDKGNNICKFCNESLLCEHYFSDEPLTEIIKKEPTGTISLKQCKICGKIFDNIEYSDYSDNTLEQYIINVIQSLVENRIINIHPFFQFAPVILKYFYSQMNDVLKTHIDQGNEKAIQFSILSFVFSFMKWLRQFNNISLYVSFVNTKLSVPELFENYYMSLLNFFNVRGNQIANIVDNYFQLNFYNKLSTQTKNEFDKEIQSLNTVSGFKFLKDQIIYNLLDLYMVFYIENQELGNEMLKFLETLPMNTLTGDRIYNIIDKEFEKKFKEQKWHKDRKKIFNEYMKKIKFLSGKFDFKQSNSKLTEIKKDGIEKKQYDFSFLSNYSFNKYQIEELESYLANPEKYINIQNFLYNTIKKISNISNIKFTSSYDDTDMLFNEFKKFTEKNNNNDWRIKIYEYIVSVILAMRAYNINPILLIERREFKQEESFTEASSDFTFSND